ncbi:MAG: MarR family winged helix-turn-helix transcriptional regulator [Clostridia bacterium]|nr:MarR family winged helix-turn-helix transcriptional regulator [Clostridia bacterium]
MQNNNLANELMNLFTSIKTQEFHKMIKVDSYTHNEKLVLFILYDLYKESGENKIMLSALRDKIRLAPSTVTPLIATLEKDGLIERVIVEEDRRNIYLKLSKKGIKYTNEAHTNLYNTINEYIIYMGENDTKEFIRLLLKTQTYFKERIEKNI